MSNEHIFRAKRAGSDRVARKRNMDDLSFEVRRILRHYFDWGFYYPAVRLYNTITN